MTTTGIFLKQEKKLEGLARKRARRERGYPSERSETFHRFSLFMWDWPRPRQGRWRKSDWLLSKFPFPWPPLRLHFRLSFYLVPLCLTILFFLRPFFVFSLLPLLTPWRGWCVPREKKGIKWPGGRAWEPERFPALLPVGPQPLRRWAHFCIWSTMW